MFCEKRRMERKTRDTQTKKFVRYVILKDHDCATVVEHPEWGKGKPVHGSTNSR